MVDLTDMTLFHNGFPHELFTHLRAEQPVLWQEFPKELPGTRDPGFWVLSRHADVQAANRDAEHFSAFDGPSLTGIPEMRGTMLAAMDAPDHTRQRRLISAGFTPRMISKLEVRAREWAITLVDTARTHSTVEFVNEIAYKLPMHMIADIVGIPVEDREWLFSLTTRFLQAASPDAEMSAAEILDVQVQMFGYAQQLSTRKRDEPDDDVWSILSNVELDGDDGEKTSLGQLELDMFFMLLTVAGSETTRNAIAGGLHALLTHPDQLVLLRSNPALLKTAVDEIIRWTSPVVYFARRATADITIQGVDIAKDDRVTLWYPSANRDSDVFTDPFTFDITRSPNPHVSFGGGGPHFCLGANLAKLEISVLFEELLKRCPNIEAAAEPTFSVSSIDSPVLLAMTEYPVHIS